MGMHILKAAWAGSVASLGDLSTILVGPEKLSQVTTGQWVSVILVGLVAIGGVYGLSQYNANAKRNGNGTGKPPAAQ